MCRTPVNQHRQGTHDPAGVLRWQNASRVKRPCCGRYVSKENEFMNYE